MKKPRSIKDILIGIAILLGLLLGMGGIVFIVVAWLLLGYGPSREVIATAIICGFLGFCLGTIIERSRHFRPEQDEAIYNENDPMSFRGE